MFTKSHLRLANSTIWSHHIDTNTKMKSMTVVSCWLKKYICKSILFFQFLLLSFRYLIVFFSKHVLWCTIFVMTMIQFIIRGHAWSVSHFNNSWPSSWSTLLGNALTMLMKEFILSLLILDVCIDMTSQTLTKYPIQSLNHEKKSCRPGSSSLLLRIFEYLGNNQMRADVNILKNSSLFWPTF